MRYLLDTSTCVFIMRGKYAVDREIERIGIENCCISEITVAELLYGAHYSNNAGNIKMTEQFVSCFSIIPIGNTLEEYACQKTRLRKSGISVDDFDLLIACAGIVHHLTVVTDNVKHFNHLPIKIENWVRR